MRGHLPASRAAKRQRRRPENEPRYCRARRRAAHCSAKASASSAPCLRSSAPDAASISRLANMSLARAFHTSPPSQNGTAAGCRTRLHRTKHALEICIGQRLSHGARRLACGGRIGPPRPNRLVSACWGASEIGSDFSNGGLRPKGDWWAWATGPRGAGHSLARPQNSAYYPLSAGNPAGARGKWVRISRRAH